MREKVFNRKNLEALQRENRIHDVALIIMLELDPERKLSPEESIALARKCLNAARRIVETEE